VKRNNSENIKLDHINLSFDSQANFESDQRFFYEPMFATSELKDLSLEFLGKKMQMPLWISSMTGGSRKSKDLNHIFAKACKKHGLAMGLGSCRVLLENDDPSVWEDFDVKEILGDQVPYFANLGIAQVEKSIDNLSAINEMVDRLQVDGLIIHVNILQELFQKEGDRILVTPIETLQKLRAKFKKKLIVKEVGQGMGPKSLESILKIGFDGLETASFGGTNFTMLEAQRFNHIYDPSLMKVGHCNQQMIATLNKLNSKMELIISGGVNQVIDAYYYRKIYGAKSVIGQAANFLKYALQGELVLDSYIEQWRAFYSMCENSLTLKSEAY
jgi:isopentenyl-diphosphate delta-isomerase